MVTRSLRGERGASLSTGEGGGDKSHSYGTSVHTYVVWKRQHKKERGQGCHALGLTGGGVEALLSIGFRVLRDISVLRYV